MTPIKPGAPVAPDKPSAPAAPSATTTRQNLLATQPLRPMPSALNNYAPEELPRDQRIPYYDELETLSAERGDKLDELRRLVMSYPLDRAAGLLVEQVLEVIDRPEGAEVDHD